MESLSWLIVGVKNVMSNYNTSKESEKMSYLGIATMHHGAGSYKKSNVPGKVKLDYPRLNPLTLVLPRYTMALILIENWMFLLKWN